MKKPLLSILLAAAFILTGPPSFINAWADNSLSEKPVVILDAGHTENRPGATSITGKNEVEYNDHLVSRISGILNGAGYKTVLTRKPGQDISLEQRTEITNSHNTLVMLSIHHDSAQLVHLKAITADKKATYRTLKPITGYSIFVSKKNPQFAGSLIMARILGEELLKIGRKPSLHHAEAIPGEGRPLLDRNLGIYQYDNLAVLKNSRAPAVLLEVGVIVDQLDEAYVTNKDNQTSIANAVLAAIGKFQTRKERVSKP